MGVTEGDPPDVATATVNASHAGKKLRNGLISLALLVVLAVGLLLAIPGLHGVGKAIAQMSAGWVVVGVALEVLSCLGYVLVFLQVFERAPIRFGARVALTEQAFGAAVSLGGAGSLAVGAWLLVERGAPPGPVAERSAVLFLLTSAINVITLILAGLLLFFGVLPGPSNPLLSIVPAAVGIAVLAFFLALPRFANRIATARPGGKIAALATGTSDSIRDTSRYLRSFDWRLMGAIGYLWFDIGVLLACFAATGHVPSVASVVLAYQIAYITNVLPIPGNIGILDASFVGMLVLYGVNATDAAAATLVYHAIALWVPALWGTLAFILLRRSRNQPLTLRSPRSERARP
jgi:uncharacterized membrane protein YbhN (UPF0104 family)